MYPIGSMADLKWSATNLATFFTRSGFFIMFFSVTARSRTVFSSSTSLTPSSSFSPRNSFSSVSRSTWRSFGASA